MLAIAEWLKYIRIADLDANNKALLAKSQEEGNRWKGQKNLCQEWQHNSIFILM